MIVFKGSRAPSADVSRAPVLARVRAWTLAFGIIVPLSMLGQLDLKAGTGLVIASAIAIAAVPSLMVFTRVQGRLFPLESFLFGPLIVIAAVSLRDPLGATGMCVATAVTQSLYGSGRATVVRTAMLVPVLPLAVTWSTTVAVSWHDPSVIVQVPVSVMFAVLMRVLKSALETQEQTAAREALLAATSRQLLGCTDPVQVQQIMICAARDLATLTPGLVLVTMSRDDSVAKVLRVQGASAVTVGRQLPIDTVVAADASSFDSWFGRRREWRTILLDHDPAAEADGAILVVGLNQRLPQSLVDSISTLSAQMSMAETACRAHAELERRAHVDHLTSMPNRVVLFQRLGQAVELARITGRQAAVMVIDLDDFKTVNDTFGHAAGDALLVEIASRMSQIVGDTAMVARFGGDEFAVLISAAGPSEQPMDVAQALRARVLEPVNLPNNITVTVGCSIGIAFSDDAPDAGGLLRCADIAMYAAKAGGKNRVEEFSEARHGEIVNQRIARLPIRT